MLKTNFQKGAFIIALIVDLFAIIQIIRGLTDLGFNIQTLINSEWFWLLVIVTLSMLVLCGYFKIENYISNLSATITKQKEDITNLKARIYDMNRQIENLNRMPEALNKTNNDIYYMKLRQRIASLTLTHNTNFKRIENLPIDQMKKEFTIEELEQLGFPEEDIALVYPQYKRSGN